MRKPTWEAKMFKEIRDERPHVSQISWVYIDEPKSRCFAHIVPKWMFPKYRLLKNNIMLVATIEEHAMLDKAVNWKKMQLAGLIKEWIELTYKDILNM